VKKEGWQFNVEIKNRYVTKRRKTKKQIEKSIMSYILWAGKPKSRLRKWTKRTMDDIDSSMSIIKVSDIPLKLLAYPEFLSDKQIRQRKVTMLSDKWEKLAKKGKNKEIRKLILSVINFVFELWRYRIHEKTFKFGTNYGLLDGELVLVDFFEITDNYEKVKKQIKNKKLHKSKFLSDEDFGFLLKSVKKALTVKNLDKYWGKKS